MLIQNKNIIAARRARRESRQCKTLHARQLRRQPNPKCSLSIPNVHK